ncbi:MFS transporter [Micromonospora sp. U21]|uniref:MFS transporter n=1 Tax=Micromonospora sp. U21 TaxID=2824899 RepID=UPI001B38A486|nr:MFS transporter [Micromonospora sp. U21]MBQ0905002.1 MFS transporter [Micromonospora sp. U21]
MRRTSTRYHLAPGVVASEPVSRGNLRLLQLTSFTSALDRASIAPIILLIARDLHRSVDAVALVATSYFFAYGIMQLVWAMVSERLGRVRTMRLALALACLSGAFSVVAPGLPALLAARTIAGATFAAAVPGALIYIGDTLPMHRRQPALADLATGTALGLTIGTVAAAVVAEHLGWRSAFAVTAVVAGVLAMLLSRLPEPRRGPRQPLFGRLPVLARNRGALVVLSMSWLEGFTVLGFLVFVPTVLQTQGASPSMSGLVVAVYGIGVVASAAGVKRLARRRSPGAIIGAGGACLIAAFTLLAISRSAVAAFVACALLGAAWALMHTSLQAWATDVAPESRALVVSAFAAMLFIGNAAGTYVGGLLLAGPANPLLFVLPAAIGVPLSVVATIGRSRHVASTPSG